MKTPLAMPDPEDSRPTNTSAAAKEPASDASNPRPAEHPSVSDVDAPGGPDSPATAGQSAPRDVASRGSNVPGPAAVTPTEPTSSSLLDPALCLAADVLDDLERVRIANENRVRQMTRSVEDSDGEERGFGLDASHPDVVKLAEIVANLIRLEHEATLELQRRLRKHPLGGWVKATRGVGEKQGARLLAAIGDPYINSAKGSPRTVSALWAYAGLHVLPARRVGFDALPQYASGGQLPGGQAACDDQTAAAAGGQHRDTDQNTTDALDVSVGVAAKRRKGERANWSTKAKMRAYLIAESCIKQLHPDCRDGHNATDARSEGAVPAQTPQDQADQNRADAHMGRVGLSCGCSPYRVVYDMRRAHTAVTHPEWTDGHSHNDGLRVASKAILRDLWRAARDWHLAQEKTS